MDSRIRDALRRMYSDPTDVSSVVDYYTSVVRAGGAHALELGYLAPAIDEITDLQEVVDSSERFGAPSRSWITVYGKKIHSIIRDIEANALGYLSEHWGVDAYTSPIDEDPRVCYLGWDYTRDVLVSVFSTEREQFHEVATRSFFYGFFRYVDGHLVCVGGWNSSNAPQESPATLSTIESNHSPIHLFNELEMCSSEAEIMWDNYAEVAYAAEVGVCSICGIITDPSPPPVLCGDGACVSWELLEQTREEASEFINLYTYEELTEMPSVSEGHFANLKIDTGRVRLWLSRCTAADGCPFEYPIEIEIFNPISGGWVQYADYPSDGDDQDPSNVVWHS
jgi:hypothetical protein